MKFICVERHSQNAYAWVGETIEEVWENAKNDYGYDSTDDVQFFEVGKEIKVKLKLVVE